MAYSKMKRRIAKRINKIAAPFNLKLIDTGGFHTMSDVGEINHIIDVGVAFGTPDLYARFPAAYLDLFEPHPDHLGDIKSQILSKRDSRLHECALGSAPGEAELFLTGPTGSSLLKNAVLNYDKVKRITVPVKRLDAVLSEQNIKKRCLLKVDVEGYDYQVLQGASELLKHIDVVVSEVRFHHFENYNPGDLIGYLNTHGFKLKEMIEVFVDRSKILCGDFVFVR